MNVEFAAISRLTSRKTTRGKVEQLSYPISPDWRRSSTSTVPADRGVGRGLLFGGERVEVYLGQDAVGTGVRRSADPAARRAADARVSLRPAPQLQRSRRVAACRKERGHRDA